jgi:hypothetical protein
MATGRSPSKWPIWVRKQSEITFLNTGSKCHHIILFGHMLAFWKNCSKECLWILSKFVEFTHVNSVLCGFVLHLQFYQVELHQIHHWQEWAACWKTWSQCRSHCECSLFLWFLTSLLSLLVWIAINIVFLIFRIYVTISKDIEITRIFLIIFHKMSLQWKILLKYTKNDSLNEECIFLWSL